jgi:hypothetical protein
MSWRRPSAKKAPGHEQTERTRRPRPSALVRGTSLGTLVILVTAVSLYSTRSAGAAGTITLVKQVASATQQSYTASNTITLTVPAGGVAQGDTLIIFAGNNYTTTGAASAADSKGNTYTVDAQKANPSNTTSTTVLSGYVSTGLVAGNTITVTYSSPATMRMALATEWSGIAPAGRVDRTATNTGNTAALSSGATTATTQATELVVGSFADGANETFTAGTGFTAFPTQLIANLGSSYRTQWQEYKTSSATGTQTAVANSTAASPYAGLAVTYRARATDDTSAPAVPANLGVTGSTASSISVGWTASSDDVGVAGYTLYRGTTAVGTTATPSGTFGGLTCGTSYTLGVDAFDAAGNHSSASTLVARTAACDTTAPSVTLSAPGSGATVTGTTSVAATAGDDVGVAGVQFKLDGANLQAEDTSSPYGVSWDTTGAVNGAHVLTATARDAAGNITTSGQVSVVVRNDSTATSPTPSPAASSQGVLVGNGFIDASARQVVRTANNVVYVIVADDDACQGGGSGSLHISKGVGSQPGNPYVPTSFVEQDAAHRPVSASTADCTYSAASMLQGPDSRLDNAGIIHTVYADGQTGNVYYQTFSTLTDLWGSRVVIGTGARVSDGSSWPRSGQVALSLDSHDVPHVAYVSSGTSNVLRYTDRVGGSWSSPATVASGTNLMHPTMVTALDGTLHLAWLSNSLATHADIYYAHYAGGTWSTPELVSSGDTNVLSNGDSDQGPGITVNASGTPQVVFMDGGVSASNDYVRMRYRTTAGVWTDNTPPGGTGGTSNANGTWFAHTPQNYTSANGSNFVFLGHDKNIEFGYQYQLGGTGTNWGAYTTLDPQRSSAPAAGDTCEPGTDGSASIRFDPLRDNNPGIIDVIYFDEEDDSDCAHHHARVFYKAVAIGTPAADSTAPTVSLTSPTNGASVTGSSVALSALASDDVGVSGVQFKLDGTNLGAEDTSSPYGLTWDSTTVSDGNHTLSAVARDAAGNVATSTVDVNVSNPHVNDVSPPTVNITSPTGANTVSGVVNVTADAADDVAVANVQFKLDGSNLGAAVAGSPYVVSWNTTTAAAGGHTLTAVATDTSGKQTTSTSVAVSVNNVSQLLLGSQTIQSGVDSTAGGQAEAFQIGATATGTLNRLSFYVSSGSTATTLIVGIYSDDSNKPGTLLTTGSVSAPTAGAWNSVSVAPIGLTSGTRYWLAALGTGGTLRFRDATRSSYRSASSSQTTLTALPATFAVGASFTDGNLSAYGSS